MELSFSQPIYSTSASLSECHPVSLKSINSDLLQFQLRHPSVVSTWGHGIEYRGAGKIVNLPSEFAIRRAGKKHNYCSPMQ